jgi:hypothetical protein
LANSRAGATRGLPLPLFTHLPRATILGNSVADLLDSRKTSGRGGTKKVGA